MFNISRHNCARSFSERLECALFVFGICALLVFLGTKELFLVFSQSYLTPGNKKEVDENPPATTHTLSHINTAVSKTPDQPQPHISFTHRHTTTRPLCLLLPPSLFTLKS